MRLKPEEAVMFYEIFLPLLDHVNENHHVIMEPVHSQEKASIPEMQQRRHTFFGSTLNALMIILLKLHCRRNIRRFFQAGSIAFPEHL